MPRVPLSDDEAVERLSRMIADFNVRMGIALAGLAASCEQVNIAMSQFGRLADEWRRADEASMSPDERDFYNDLRLNGMPWLDAAVKARKHLKYLKRTGRVRAKGHTSPPR